MQHVIEIGRVDQPRLRSRRQGLALLLLLSALSGCVTPWEKSALMRDTSPNISDVQGPTERKLNWLKWNRKVNAPADDSASLKPLVGTEEYLAATELFEDKRYAEAQAAFKKVAKKYKKSEIREDALFMEGESAFQQDHYSKAHDYYAMLLKEFPSTRHLDVVSERLFKIGRIWLDFPEVAKLDEIKQVNFENPKQRLPAEEPPKIKSTPIFVPNTRDKTRPLFDTQGNGVAALQAIWMNDPTGPLADDAMMLVASHYARKGSYVEADRYFRMLRETFPNSPHLQSAFLLGSHVKLMSYQGPDYDGKALNDAQQLKESTLRLYPYCDDADRLRFELQKIEDAKAEREWKKVEFWIRKKNLRAASVECHLLISQFPKSKFAEMAREQLEKFGPEYTSGAVLLNPHDPKKLTVWQRIIPGAAPKPQPVVTAPATDGAAPNSESSNSDSPPKTDKPPSRWLPKRQNTKPSKPVDEQMDAPETDHPEDLETPNQAKMASDTKEATSKRRWPWSTPKRLPPDNDDNATELPESNQPGRTKL